MNNSVQTSFRMDVVDVFNLLDGRTVFAGRILDYPGIVRAMHCKLYLNEVARMEIILDGELIMDPGKANIRAVSTSQRIPFTRNELVLGRCRIEEDHKGQVS